MPIHLVVSFLKDFFGLTDGDGRDKKLPGKKGANLCEMPRIWPNTPSGLVISTAARLEYLYCRLRELPAGVINGLFCNALGEMTNGAGPDYASCSTRRAPVARLITTHAAILADL